MKKFAIILLALCLFASLFAVAALAEGTQIIDLSQYDDDTIVELYEQVKEELVTRHIEKTAHLKASPVPYVVGRDIPVGDYLLTKTSGSGFICLDTAIDEETGMYDTKVIESVGEDEDFTAYITAEEGDTLELDFDCDLTISTGVKFE